METMVRVCVRVCACVYVNFKYRKRERFLFGAQPDTFLLWFGGVQGHRSIHVAKRSLGKGTFGDHFEWMPAMVEDQITPPKKCSLAWDVAMLQFLEENLEYWSSFFRKLFLQEWRHPVRWQNPFPNYLIQPIRKSNLFWWTMDKKSGES